MVDTRLPAVARRVGAGGPCELELVVCDQPHDNAVLTLPRSNPQTLLILVGKGTLHSSSPKQIHKRRTLFETLLVAQKGVKEELNNAFTFSKI